MEVTGGPSTALGKSASWPASALWAAGLALIFAGERLAGAGKARLALTLTGLAAVAAATALRALRWKRAQGDARAAERLILILQLVGAGALLLYFAQSDLARVGGKAIDQALPRVATALSALWPALMAAAVLPVLLAEMAYASMARAPQVEIGRVREAVLSGLGLVGALVFAFATYYVASARDVKADLAYFRTTRAGTATKAAVRALDAPVEVSLFFPPANEVQREVAEYFSDLTRESKHLEVKSYDQAVDVAKARELGVTGNGAIVVSRGSRREQLLVALQTEGARSQLAKLDGEVQKRLLQVARQRRTVYFTTGHGERDDDKASPTDQRFTIRTFRQLLGQQNHDTRELGAAEGLGSEIPKDAAALFVVGPTEPFLPEEVAAIGKYLDRGGRLLVALDPEAGKDFSELLKPLGLKLAMTALANDQVYLRRNDQPSDRGILVAASTSSHPAVATIGRLGGRAPVVLVGSGSLEELPEKPKDTTVDITVRSHAASFNDANGNYQFDAPAETRKSWSVAAAVTRHAAGQKPEEEARAVVLADSDCLGDAVLENAGNAYLALDGARWLLGDESLAGETSSEEDKPVQHTRRQNVAWFYSTVFAGPALVLLAGFFVTRRRGRKARAEKAPSAPAAQPQEEKR